MLGVFASSLVTLAEGASQQMIASQYGWLPQEHLAFALPWLWSILRLTCKVRQQNVSSGFYCVRNYYPQFRDSQLWEGTIAAV